MNRRYRFDPAQCAHIRERFYLRGGQLVSRCKDCGLIYPPPPPKKKKPGGDDAGRKKIRKRLRLDSAPAGPKLKSLGITLRGRFE